MSATISEPTGSAPARGGWLIGPRSDALWIVNLGWPLVALIGWYFYSRWNLLWVYLFLAASHRWLTLPLLAMDWHEVRPRRRFIAAIFAWTVAGYAALRFCGVPVLTINVFVILFDSWHRCAQHFGLVRLYERAEGQGNSGGRAWWHGENPRLLQVLVLYTFLRSMSVAATIGGYPYLEMFRGTWVRIPDTAGLLLACWIVLSAVIMPKRQPDGTEAGLTMRPFYLASAATMYALMLSAVSRGSIAWAAAVYAAGSYFHAMEYFAVVSRRIEGRRQKLDGWRLRLAGGWVPALVGFIAVIGGVGWFMPPVWAEAWFGLNLVVSLLHYQIDGIIWHRPKVAV